MKIKKIPRRHFLKLSSTLLGGMIAVPYLNCAKNRVQKPMKREFGKSGFEVTTFGLGGQSSLQWTPPNVDPVKIILKAFHLGVNYFDTSNIYGPSQINFGKAFQRLDLIPDQVKYNEKLRRSIWLTSKTHLRWAKGGLPLEGVNNWTSGKPGSATVDDLKQSLSQIFGDGQGNYPPGAYLDMILIHNLTCLNDVNAVYEGLAKPDSKAENIGALAALRDYRDGSNLTGLNPKEEKLVRHLGFSGHFSPAVMMEMIQRDQENILDGMLVAINSNDRLNFNMQYNVIPVAQAKNMGIIAMKVFADGAMYSKGAHWSHQPEHIVHSVGTPELPSAPLIQYSLTTPGIHTAIIGIGHIDDNPLACQLEQNLSAAQIKPEERSEVERRSIEKMTVAIKAGKTNYFQSEAMALTPVQKPAINQQRNGDQRKVTLSWHTAFAGDEPIRHYEIWRDGQKVARIEHKPQTTKTPFSFEEQLTDNQAHSYKIITIDAMNRQAPTNELKVSTI